MSLSVGVAGSLASAVVVGRVDRKHPESLHVPTFDNNGLDHPDKRLTRSANGDRVELSKFLISVSMVFLEVVK